MSRGRKLHVYHACMGSRMSRERKVNVDDGCLREKDVIGMVVGC